jgi:hypothetical protein
MKHLSYILVSLYIIFFMSCGASRINNQTPFVIERITFEENVLKLALKHPLSDHVLLQNVYVGKEVSKLNSSLENSLTFLADFNDIPQPKRLLILHADPRHEFGNESPLKMKEIAFELSDNECIISYLENGKLKYFKTEFSL